MSELTPEAVRREIRDLYGFSDETWAAIEALSAAEKRIRDGDRAAMLAHMEQIRATLPDRLRAEGHDVPEGMEFEWRT